MTPGARVAAAIEILDAIANGSAAEQALTRWARGSRFAGSKDRAAIRDHVFDVLRHWRSDAVRGGAETGRARMIGRLRAQDIDPDTVFDGGGYGPAPLSDDEKTMGAAPEAIGDRWDMPDWLVPHFQDSLAAKAEATALALTGRAPVTLRVNLARGTRGAAARALAEEGIVTTHNPRAESALTVTEGARKVRHSEVFTSGLIEVQDAAGQAAVAGLMGSGKALDFCAGGGGKALAMAAAGWDVTAHDVAPARMKDIPVRAARGGHRIALCMPVDLARAGQFDLVFCDAPCSGSGTWRRAPEAKWALTPDRLSELVGIQASVLEAALPHVAPNGVLAYATCSALKVENQAQIERFLRAHPDWQADAEQHWPVDDWGDGFYCTRLTQRA